MEKEQRMCLVIIKKGNTTEYKTIGDNLERELYGYVVREIENKMYQAKIIN
jgi:hypothetical protein